MSPATELGVPFVDLDELSLDRQLLSEVPIELMVRYSFLPLERRAEGALVVAFADPDDMAALDALEGLLDTPLEIRAAAPDAVERALRRAGAGERILASVQETFGVATTAGGEQEQGLTLASLAADSGHPIVRLVDTTVLNALERRASDIHIETRDDGVWIKYRIDGVLYPAMEPIELRHHDAIVSRVKVMSDLDIAEKRVPQDGRFKLNLQGRTVDFRVSIMPAIHGEDAVIRILDKESLAEEFSGLRLDALGFTATDMRMIRKYMREPYGMFLVTGPTGSGKTTTLYAALARINDNTRNIMTIEDPIEYYIDGIGQSQVNNKVKMTFARGLRAILRQDPDVVMVGEIRDLETAEIAVQASLTGHLVLSTLHTNTAVGAVTRLRDMGIEPFLLASSLIGAVAQRLVRLLCTACREPYAADASEKKLLQAPPREKLTLYRAAACAQCNQTGYSGRTGIYELVVIDDTMKSMIHERASEHLLEEHARSQSASIRADGRSKVLAGITTLEEVLRVTRED